VQHDQPCYLSFRKIGATFSTGQRHLYTARDNRMNILRAFYSTVTHPSTNHAILTLLNFGDRTGTGVFNVTWPYICNFYSKKKSLYPKIGISIFFFFTYPLVRTNEHLKIICLSHSIEVKIHKLLFENSKLISKISNFHSQNVKFYKIYEISQQLVTLARVQKSCQKGINTKHGITVGI
jgi:hypothetical protein